MSGPDVVLADADPARRSGLVASLETSGFRVLGASSVAELMAATGEAGPKVLVVHASLVPDAGCAHVDALRSRGVAAIVLGDETTDVPRFLSLCADDVVRLPAQLPELGARVQRQLRAAQVLDALSTKERDAKAMLELTQTLASALDFSEILYTVVRRIAEVVNVGRVSIVLAPPQGDTRVGYVVAASDNAGITNLRIDLDKYPEILEVLRTHEMLAIDDPATHPLLEGVRDEVPPGRLGGLSLLPITWQDEAMGVLFLRALPGRGGLTTRELDFCRIVTNATAVALRNARVMQTLRDQTQQVNFARFEAERRLRNLKRYANLFTSAADGLAAVDRDGMLLFANPKAHEMTGLAEGAFKSRPIIEVTHPSERERMTKVWKDIRRGVFPPQAIDLRLSAPGPVQVVNCSFAPLQEGDGAILMSFRDVTAERATAAELRRTKEFLESLIEASVDAIIAADLRGNVLLFNRGAERIYGWKAEEVIGRLRVTELYPPGGAREVMRLLRASTHGGAGQLESIRFEAIGKDGERIPISLSAATIEHDGVPSATVGIFTDLREKLRVEERLLQAQEKLEMSEKQSIVAELAGAAAHELNQPLTSVMGYAELLRRKLPPDSPEHHAATVIGRETDRMADIVRKIGKMTKYETKSYVGGARILDLDRASGEDAERGGS